MPRIVEARLLDFSGGLNDGLSPAEINSDELSAIKNLYPYRRHLKRRKGRRRITNSVASAAVTGILALKRAPGDWTLICGLSSGFARVQGELFVALSGSEITNTMYPWEMKQYKNIGYAVRRDRTGIIRLTETTFGSAGIAAPSTAPTLADSGVAGNPDAGSYYGVVTFVNLETDNESNPSAASAVVTTGAARKISWSAIPVSVNSQVNARRLYRTLVGQTGEYYLVTTISDNTTTTYTDNALVEDLGGQASYRHEVPPTTEELLSLEVWRERLWAVSATGLYFSEEYLPECFDETSYIQIAPDDGHEMRAAKAFGDRLVWGKTNSVGFITGTGPSDFSVQVLDDRNGVIAGSSLQVADGFIFWYSGQNVFQSDGVSVRPISDPKIRTVLDSIPESYKPRVVGAVYPRLGWYLLSVPTAESEVFENWIEGSELPEMKLLVFNYREQAWASFDYASSAPIVMGDFYDSEKEPRLYGAFSGIRFIYDLTDPDQLNDDPTDLVTDAANITCSFRTKALDFNQPGKLHAVKSVAVMCNDTGADSTWRLYRDIEATASKERTDVALYSASGRRWKRGALSAMTKKSYQTAFEMEYTGYPDITVEGVLIEGSVWGWKEQAR